MQYSTKPYLIRALYEWCTENSYTPYIAVKIDSTTRVPRQFIQNNEIVLNIGFNAINQLKMGNKLIEFITRFSGRAYKIEIPILNVLAIYARENGNGMAFENMENCTVKNSNQERLPSDIIKRDNFKKSDMVLLPSKVSLNSNDDSTSSKLNRDERVVDIKRSRGHLKLVK